MAEFLNDRQRTELALPAHILLNVLMAGAEIREEPVKPEAEPDGLPKRETYAYKVKAYATYLECRDLLRRVLNEINQDLPNDRRYKLLRRVERLNLKLAMPFIEAEARVEKFGLVAFYFLQHLVSDQHIVVGEDGDFQKALDLLLPGLEHIAAEEKVDRSAQKQARRAYQQIQREGYYRRAA